MLRRKWIRTPLCAFLALSLAFFALSGPAQAAGVKFSMSYIYFGTSSAYVSKVDAAGDSLNEISPNYFNLASDGSLQLTNAVSAGFVTEMHSRGMTVVPFLSNHWDRVLGQAALANRASLAAQLAAAVAAYDLDGVSVDLENLTPAERADYVDFVRLLRAALGQDKVISVAVAANPYGYTTGWQGSYDYAGLAAYSNDLVIMAYDEHYQGGSAGPVASTGFVKRSLEYALSLVPKDQVVLSVPFYGRIWRSGGGYPQGYGISNTAVDSLVATHGGQVTFDSKSGTACATITINAADTKPVLGGTELTAGTYTIWYSDEQTIKGYLDLVRQYDIKGAGSWSLGQESAGTWNYYSFWLSGLHWSDAENHWARDAVYTAFARGWMQGVSTAAFRPDAALTRAEAAVILVRALGLPTAGITGQDFSDTAGHWAQAEIAAARQYGLIGGIGNNLFEPNRPVTRQEMAVILNNLLSARGVTQTQTPTVFPDVTRQANSWSYDAIYALSGYGIIQGGSDGGFHPGSDLTRAEMAVLTGRLMARLNG